MKRFIIELYLKLKGLKRYYYFKKLKERDNLSATEIQKFQWYRLKRMIGHCYKDTVYYRELFDSAGITPDDIQTMEDLKKIPPLTKQLMVENTEDIKSNAFNEAKARYIKTSGSTGIPVNTVHSLDDHEYSFGLRYRSNNWCGFDFRDKSVWFVANLRGDPKKNISLREKIRTKLLNRIELDIKYLDDNVMRQWVKKINKFKPRFAYGYYGIMEEFAKFIIENNIEIKGIEGVFSHSARLKDRALLQKAFNANVYDQYGSCEFSCIAHECKKGSMHINADEIMVEFGDIEGNETLKKLYITSLYSYGFPMLRYEIGDCAIYKETKCDCGLPYPVMEISISRNSDNIITPTGKIVDGIRVAIYLSETLEEIKRFQLIQIEPNNFKLRLAENNTTFRKENERKSIKLLSDLISANAKVEFEYPKNIPLAKNGKIRQIISAVGKIPLSVS